jgi:hypothetical protein
LAWTISQEQLDEKEEEKNIIHKKLNEEKEV